MTFWIITYTHRHGSDVWPVFADTAPSEDEIASGLDDWEPDRDEFIEIAGPFTVPAPVPA